MGQRFIKGLTNNHLTWVMVDSTDFATPESALSAATKIKIYGKLRSATGVNFVSSGTGSLTNDIQHVGASALGIYTIALAKADLSDASAAWYDQYVISLSATGAAYQALIVDGGIVESVLLAYSDAISDAQSDLKSYLAVMSGVQSDLYSAVSDLQSDFQSRVPKRVATDSQLSDLHSDLKSYLAVMSGVQSDLYSLLSDHHSDFQSRVPKRVATDSQLSDLASDLKSYLAVMSDVLSDTFSTMNSQFLVTSNYLSYLSNVVSGLGAGQSASAIADKVWSDYASKVGVTASQAYSYLSATLSGLGAGQSASAIADKVWSDFTSKAGASPSQLYSVCLIGASAASDAASAAQQTNSRVLLNLSRISDIASYLVVMSGVQSDLYSAVSDLQSDFQSRVPKRVATDSQLSDLASDLKSYLTVMSGVLSDAYSAAVAIKADTAAVKVQTDKLVFTVANQLDANVLSWLSSTPNALISGRLDVNTQALATAVIAAGSFAAGAIDAAAIAANALGASELATDAVNEIVAAVFARAFTAAYGSYTFDQLTSMMSVALLAKCSGMGTTTGIFRNLADSADVITATIDASGNRTAITLAP